MIRKASAIDFRHILTKVSSEASSTGKTPLKYIGRVVDFSAGINLSIRAKILLSLCIVILLMGTTNAMLVMQVLNYSRQYDAIITNITTANSISGNIKPDIDTEMWKIVAGKIDFKEGKQYDIINEREHQIALDDGQHRLAQGPRSSWMCILRTMQTLTQYVDLMGEQIAT